MDFAALPVQALRGSGFSYWNCKHTSLNVRVNHQNASHAPHTIPSLHIHPVQIMYTYCCLITV